MKGIVDKTEMINLIDTINLLVRDQQINISNFKEIFQELSYHYTTDNKDKISLLSDDVYANLNIININSINNISVLTTALEKYSVVDEEITKKFENIGKNN